MKIESFTEHDACSFGKTVSVMCAYGCRGAMVYTTNDLPIMNACFEEMIPMIVERLGGKDDASTGHRCADGSSNNRGQPKLHEFFKQTGKK